MTHVIKSFVVALGLTLAFAASAEAQTAPAAPISPDQFAEAIGRYDPESVAAARTYATIYNIRGMVDRTAPGVAQRLAQHVKSLNPNLSDDNIKIFVDTFMQSAMVDNSAVLEQAAELTVLEAFSKDELAALAQFYASPIGAKILQKAPAIMTRLPQILGLMQTYVVPKATQAAEAALRARSVEVKM
ncbi:MAG: DUF2059 domain-containing protein [Roseiarcus sp.]